MLTGPQLEDLAQLHAVADEFGADVVIIGAAALLCFIDLGRFTRDVDVVVALEIEDFEAFSARLAARGWTRQPRGEHRWHAPGGSLIDLIPAGPGLRAAGRIVWPESEFEMSLVAFEHVFSHASLFTFAGDIQYKVAPPPVLALLKIVSFMDAPLTRRKDLIDLRTLFRQYEAASDRIFDDEVFAAELEDIEYANAFLLGIDVGGLATEEEAGIVTNFVDSQIVTTEELPELEREDVRLQQQLLAFRKGFGR